MCIRDSFWGEFTCTIIRKKTTNEPIALEGSFRDITSIKSAELNQIEATKSRNMLLSYISHELRTPITSIAGYLTAISDGTISRDVYKRQECTDRHSYNHNTSSLQNVNQ